MQARVLLTASTLISGILILHCTSHGEPIMLRLPLREFPSEIRVWKGEDQSLDPKVLAALGVTDYLNRIYRSQAAQPVQVYVGYYQTQRTGEAIHSPKNCLPGSGWEPVQSDRLQVKIPGYPPIVVNSYLIEKGLDRDLVFYWYQSQGRVVASEYSAKLWMAVGAVTRNRTDGALVRLVTSAQDGEDNARARLVIFAREIYPLTRQFIPD
jgi:EpsI family protein